MTEELNRPEPMRIVTATMRKPAFFLLFLLAAVPCLAQENTQQFGFLIGGSERLYSHSDKASRDAYCAQPTVPADCPVDLPGSNFRLGDRNLAVFYQINIEPETAFRIEAGQINSDIGGNFPNPKPATGEPHPQDFRAPVHGHIQHVDGIVQYSVSEPFGKTGIFAGFGMYRWSAPTISTETNYGYMVGISGDFPITRKYGFVAEGAYHWLNMTPKSRYITLSGGLRVAF